MKDILDVKFDARNLTVARAKLSDKKLLEVIDSVCDYVLLGTCRIKLENDLQKTLFDEVISNYEKQKRRAIASAENGKKGGRPRKVK